MRVTYVSLSRQVFMFSFCDELRRVVSYDEIKSSQLTCHSKSKENNELAKARRYHPSPFQFPNLMKIIKFSAIHFLTLALIKKKESLTYIFFFSPIINGKIVFTIYSMLFTIVYITHLIKHLLFHRIFS